MDKQKKKLAYPCSGIYLATKGNTILIYERSLKALCQMKNIMLNEISQTQNDQKNVMILFM